MSAPVVDVIVPAYNQAAALPGVLDGVPRPLVRQVYVVDSASEDDTARTAAAHGAVVLAEPRRGYGAACLRGIQHVAAGQDPPDVVVFLRADACDDPAEIVALVRPIERQRLDMVIGSRTLGSADPGAIRLRDRLSREVAVTLIRAIYGQRYTDLGGFRAIRLPALVALGLTETGPGFNIEMQVKAVKAALRMAEVPVRFRNPAHAPAHPPTLAESAVASSKMLYTILRHSTTR